MDKKPTRDQVAREKFKQKHAKKIIIYGAPANKTTGNGKLIYFMAKVFQSAGHQVYTIGLEYNGPQIQFDGIPILPSHFCEICGHAHKGSIENVKKIATWINLLQPNFFICVGDPIQMQQFGIGNLGFEHMKHTFSMMYATIDSSGLFCNELLTKSGQRDYFDICDKVISTSIFTQEQFKKWLELDTNLIHETINMNNYLPVTKEKKEELRKKYRFKKDDFIIYSGGRNIMRKRHHDLIDACAKLICETKDTYLYLNIPKDEAYPDVLNPLDFVKRVLKNKYGRDLVEEGRIVFVGRGNLGSTKITETQNAELYQISDVYATTTAGEGFGLMPVESMACGVPVIVPDNSTGKETVGFHGVQNVAPPESGFLFGKGGLITCTPIKTWVDYGLEQHLTTPKNTYKALKFLYKDPELRENLGKQGRDYVLKMFNFDLFKRKWLEVIRTTNVKKTVEEEQKFKTLEIKTEEEKDGKTKKSSTSL